MFSSSSKWLVGLNEALASVLVTVIRPSSSLPLGLSGVDIRLVLVRGKSLVLVEMSNEAE